MKKIIDEFTNLKVSRQRKWQLRHPKEEAILQRRWKHSINGLIHTREYNREYFGCKRRNLNAKSYKFQSELNNTILTRE